MFQRKSKQIHTISVNAETSYIQLFQGDFCHRKNDRKNFHFIFHILFLFFFSSTFLFSSSSYSLDQLVRVHVLSKYDLNQIEITGSLAKLKVIENGSEAETLWPPQIPLQVKADKNRLNIRLGNSAQEVSQIVVIPPRGSFLTVKSAGRLEKKFIGKLMIRSNKNSLILLEELWLEEYVKAVLESEISDQFPPEALKAQAIAIRSYALAHLDKHQKEGFNFCDLTHCQVYAGFRSNHSALNQAAKQTEGIVLADHFKPIEALYHSTCGGHTSSNQKVFGGKALPYLQGVNDEKYCSLSPHFKWETSIPLKILEEVLKKDPQLTPRGNLENIRIADHEESGRAFTIAIEGKRNLTVSVLPFLSIIGKYLGWGILKSNWFEVEVLNGDVHFKGHGFGHGVGLCQWGAKGMAESGKKFDEILFHYFPGTNLIAR